ncbi:MAG: N-acetylglucosamine-6-phosphate deacetylase [Selenomonadaceae bacterium]|nr:N-acetylglucosamine-6-phosphate deacetylase [Selenomonadaceae bacterium]
MTSVINGRLIIPDDDGNFTICAGKAINFGEKIISIGNPIEDAEIIDAHGQFVSPGFINVHIHGANGVDTMDDDINALKTFANFLPSCGVTSFLPTTMTMPLDKIYRAFERIRLAKNFSGGAKILGANMEGPFISRKFNGAQAEENIIAADFSLIENFSDVIKIITVAPEEIDFEFIDRCREKNIVVSIGHSAADYDTAISAIKRGANHVTHLFNAQTPLHHRKPGIVGAALDSSVMVELIADNIHVSPTAQRITAKVKPLSQITLITDSFRACGIGEGVSELGGQKVFVSGNLARLADGTIAGSVATMNTVLKNFHVNTNLDIPSCVSTVTKNPAQELGIFDLLGSLEVGKSADIVIFDDDFNIDKTFINGQRDVASNGRDKCFNNRNKLPRLK